MRASTFIVAAASAIGAVKALDPLTIKGSKFFNSDGSQFFIKGVAYQLSQFDPLIDKTQCQIDAKLMSELGANAIRVYHVDPTQNHDDCMKIFEDIGVYAFVDLDTFATYIEQDGPPHWNQSQLDAYTQVVDAFAGYSNLGGVFVGNEIITTSTGSWAAPYIKSAVRDVKAYIQKKNYPRPVYVGYTAADISELRPNLQNYLACGDDSSVNVDFFGLNAYEWCGAATDFHVSGYDMLQKNATDYPVPIFFSETGCNVPSPRDFKDQFAIFGTEMDNTWSGAIIYEWIQEENNYGLVDYGTVDPKTAVGGGTVGRSGTPTPLPDFDTLKTVWGSITPSGISSAQYTSTNGPISCPASTAGQWNVDPNAALPSLGQTAVAGAETALVTAAPSGSGVRTGGSSSTATTSATATHNAAGRISGNVAASGGFLAAIIGAVAML